MKVLVIIVTWNGMRWVDRCIGSVLASKTQADAFVVDNASSDGIADYIATNYPEVHMVRNTCNLGFAEANNMGFRYAMENGYDYVYLLNQDAWISPDTITVLAGVYAAHPEFGLLSPEQMCADGVTFNPVFEREVVAREKEADASCGLYEVPFAPAAHWLVPVSVLRQVGLFADFLPIYGNDDDYCHRVLYHGLRIGVVRGCKVIHDKLYSPQTVAGKVYRNYYMNGLIALSDIRKPIALQVVYVLLLTLVKGVKYRSLLPFKYLWKIFGKEDRKSVRDHRRTSRK